MWGCDCLSAAHRLYSSSPYRVLLSLGSLLRPTLLLPQGHDAPYCFSWRDGVPVLRVCMNWVSLCPLIFIQYLVEDWKTNLMSLAILFHFLCAEHVPDINISIIRSLRLCCWFATSVVFFSVRCVLEFWCAWFWVVLVLQAEAQQQSRKLLMMDILMSETCWAHKKWNKIASDIKLVFHSSTITMTQGPINIRFIQYI